MTTPAIRPITEDDVGPDDTCDVCDNFPFILLELRDESHQFCLQCASATGVALRAMALELRRVHRAEDHQARLHDVSHIDDRD